MVARTPPSGSFTMAEDLTVTRMGYGAMQLADPGVFGPPKDRDAAVAVLRKAVELGITHIDTADFYGPHITNQISSVPLPGRAAHRDQGRSQARRSGRLAARPLTPGAAPGCAT
jgi:aryl-alcohol dehydrogenase-like predicted oxidoreductase